MDFQENYHNNFEALKRRKPGIVALLSDWKDQYDLELAQAEGGGFFLALATKEDSYALSETANPAMKAEQLAQRDIPGAPNYDPLLISGVRAGYELLAFFQKLHEEPGGRWQAMYVVEPSPDLFMAMMHIHDIRTIIESEHVFFFVGPEALKGLENLFLNDPMKPLPKNVTVLGHPDEAKAAAQTISATLKKRAEGALQTKNTIDEYYENINSHEWIEDLHRDKGLRFLLISSGFSHFVQYANRDISSALKSLGHETRTIGERQRVDHLTGPALLEAINEFKPHVIHHIDHMRYESAQIYPSKVIFLTSILDHFPSLENETSASKMSDWDYVTGYVSHWTKFGYREDRLLPQEPMSNEQIFKPVELSPTQMGKYGCEVSYVSNISKTPEEYLDELLGQCGADDKAIRKVAQEMFDKVREEFINGRILYQEKDYRKIFNDLDGRERMSKEMGDELINGFFALVGNAYFRQLPLIALTEAGVDLRLYGRGWGRHPKLAKHACGVVEHGKELNLVFNASAINLHINQFQMRHNRLNDGYAAEAFFLIHRHIDKLPFDVDGLLFADNEKLVGLVREFLANPEKRNENAIKNRRLVLEHFTYRAQYAQALKRMGFLFGASSFKDVVANLCDAFTFYKDSPISEMLGVHSLADIIKLTTKFDLEKAKDDHFQNDDLAGYKRNALDVMLARSVTEKMAEADMGRAKRFESKGKKEVSARYLASALFVRPYDEKIRKRFGKLAGSDEALTDLVSHRRLAKCKTISIDEIMLPFGLTMAPDGRAAVSDWAGVTSFDTRGVYLIDPVSGVVEKFVDGPGLQRGDFGTDGAYYTQLLGLDGIFRLTRNERAKIIATGEGTPYGVVLQTIVCQSGGLLLHDWSSQKIAYHDANGKFIREVIPPGKFREMRGINEHRGRLYFLSGEQIYHKDIESDAAPKIMDKAPGGMWDYLTVGEDGMYATVGYVEINSQNERAMSLAGLASMDMEGNLRFLTYKNPFERHPILLKCQEGESEKRLCTVDCYNKLLLIFNV